MPSERPKGIAVGCDGCFGLMGPGTAVPKPLLCGGCMEAYYCGPDCQRKHWPVHKQLCKRMRRGERKAEEAILAEPRRAGFRADFDKYCDLIALDVCYLALRSAFRFGKPDQLNSTHFLSFVFFYDSAPEELRARFRFAHWELVEFDERDVGRAGTGWPTRAELAERRHDKELIEGTMNGFVEFMAHDLNDKDDQSYATIRRDLGLEITALSFFRHPTGPIAVLKLNDMWDNTLARALARSPQYLKPDLRCLELLMAVGEERAIQTLTACWGHDPSYLKLALTRIKIAVAQGYLRGGPRVQGTVTILRE